MEAPSWPGPIALFGSGETSPSGRKVFETLFQKLGFEDPPQGSAAPRLALLETPAGFELNSAQVIGRVGEFLRVRLQNYRPQITTVAARHRNGPFSTEDTSIPAPLLNADLIFMGPGSPTYAVRHLTGSRTWHYLLARHRLGAALALASAAAIAVSSFSLPVYEIYKVGEDIHWKSGLDLFGDYGLALIFIPHWNNNDGGSELDTSRCFMGQERFADLMAMLPPDLTVVGIDENTALVMDFAAGEGRVLGLGSVTLIHTGPYHLGPGTPRTLSGTGLDAVAAERAARGVPTHVHIFRDGESFPLQRIGRFHIPVGGEGLPLDAWQRAQKAASEAAGVPSPVPLAPPQEVQVLLEERAAARARKDWAASDALRQQIAALGWSVLDTQNGQVLQPK